MEGTALAHGRPWKSGWPGSLGVCRVWGLHRMSGLLYPALIVSAQLRGGLTSSLHTQSPHHPEFLIILKTLTRIPNQDTGVGMGHASCRGSSPSNTDRPPCGARAFPASGTFAALPLTPGRQLAPCLPFSKRSTGSIDSGLGVATLRGRSWVVGHLNGRALQERPPGLAGRAATGMGSRGPASSEGEGFCSQGLPHALPAGP